jgi:hypothetical protein
MTAYVQLDSRGRAALGKFADGAEFFAVEELGGGNLLLRPADLVTRDDRALAARPDLVARAKKVDDITSTDGLRKA